MKIKAVIFDFDGTLYNGTGFGRALVLTSPFEALKMLAERKARRDLRGFDEEHNFYNTFFERCAFYAKKTAKKFQKWYNARYLKIFTKALKKKQFSARKGIEELFCELNKSNVKIAVFSDYGAVRERMTACGISKKAIDLCSILRSALDYGCLKPAKRGFLRIAQELSVLPGECIVVGDRNDTDGEGAKNAGMKFIRIVEKSKFKTQEILPENTFFWEDFLIKINEIILKD